MLIKRSDSIKKENTKDCTVWEYEYPSTLFSFATALINGRYPEEKSCVNQECEELYYVLSGTGVIHSDKGYFEINQGDLYFFEKGEVYWVEGRDLSLVLVNAPKWRMEQHKII